MSIQTNAKFPSPLRLLFIGNSATYVNDIPGTLKNLAEKAGYLIECERIVKGGAKLSFHADTSTIHSQTVLETIQKGFDIVFIQDNANCISSDQLKLESKQACEAFGKAIHASGARVGIYFRPPYGYKEYGLEPSLQCKVLDRHFSEITNTLDALNVYVNRAFAEAIQHTILICGGPITRTQASAARTLILDHQQLKKGVLALCLQIQCLSKKEDGEMQKFSVLSYW